MIKQGRPEYTTANLKELFDGLIKVKTNLKKNLLLVEDTYTKTRKEVAKNSILLTELKTWYESGSLNKIKIHSMQVMKIIDNIRKDEIVREIYIKQLEVILKTDRIKSLNNFYIDSSAKKEFDPLMKLSYRMDGWINNCNKNLFYLKEFIGENNPLIYKDSNRLKAKGYVAHKEEIYLGKMGIRIKGSHIYTRTLRGKKVLNTKEESLIYFLFDRLSDNENEYFNIKILSEELDTSPRYIKNCITNINKNIREIISSTTRINLKIIENKRGRGYRLNPKIL